MNQKEIDNKKTRATQSRYDRIAPIYDAMERPAEGRYSTWREKAWQLVEGPDIVEVGVGTGKNMSYYPADAHITALDISEKMLARARRRAENLTGDILLYQMDAQRLAFEDDSFDSAIATFVFCSVPDPVSGMRELRRVVKPGGKVIFLEHMRAHNPSLARLMDVLDPIVARLMGPHINRRTVDNIRESGLDIINLEELDRFKIFKLITTSVPSPR